MGSEPSLNANPVGTFFNVLERIILFALALLIGLINLMIGVVIAARLGIIPKASADRVIRAANQATGFASRIMGTPRSAPAKHKAKP